MTLLGAYERWTENTAVNAYVRGVETGGTKHCTALALIQLAGCEQNTSVFYRLDATVADGRTWRP